MSVLASASTTRPPAPFGLLSLIAVAIGCGVAHASEVPTGVWVRNPISWAIGAFVAVLIARLAGPRTMSGFLVAAPLGLLATLSSAGQLGVHRWLDIGPLHINAAQVLLPPAIAACAAPGAGRVWPWPAAAAIALLVAQPDASQATALGGALLVLVAASCLSRAVRAGGMLLIALAVAASWLRLDPLAPVPEVEGIMTIAWAISPPLAIAAWAALLAAVGSVMLVKRLNANAGPRALCAYAALSAVTPLFGAFPVPLVGMAMSPILGLWLGAGVLAAQARPTSVSTYTPAASAG